MHLLKSWLSRICIPCNSLKIYKCSAKLFCGDIFFFPRQFHPFHLFSNMLKTIGNRDIAKSVIFNVIIFTISIVHEKISVRENAKIFCGKAPKYKQTKKKIIQTVKMWEPVNNRFCNFRIENLAEGSSTVTNTLFIIFTLTLVIRFRSYFFIIHIQIFKFLLNK